MNTIIHEITKKITTGYTNILEDLVNGSKDFSKFIVELKKVLDEVGTELSANSLEFLDDIIRDSKSRKNEYNVQRRNDKKSIMTVFGEVSYCRTYYKSKKDGSYVYLSDEMVGIEPHDRKDMSYDAALIEESLDSSYQKTGETVTPNMIVSKQTVLNTIRKR